MSTEDTRTPEERIEALANKNKELLDKIAGFSDMKKQLDELGGFESVKAIIGSSEELKAKVKEATLTADQVREQLNKKLEEKDNKIKDMVSKIGRKRAEDKMKAVVAENGGIWDLIEHKISSRVKYEYDENTDDVNLTVLNEKGEPAVQDGNPLGLADLVNEFKGHEVLKRAFEVNKERSGTGAPVTLGTIKTVQNNPFLTNDLDAQTALFRKNPDLARRMQRDAKAQAAKN